MQKYLNQLKNEVFSRQRTLEKIYRGKGSQSLFDYAQSWQIAKSSEADVFIDVFEKEIKKIYSSQIAEGAVRQIKQTSLISTIDHHGILNHPFFINSNLIFSLRQDLKYLICLSTAGVSLNNSSWPGALVLSRKGRLKRFSFFPDKMKMSCVLTTPAVKSRNIEKVLKEIKNDPIFSEKEKNRLNSFVSEIFSQGFEQADFSSQASLFSSRAWQVFFPKAPALIYLPIEKIISEIFRCVIVPGRNHILHYLFFSKEGLDLLEKYFQGSLGAFSSIHKGSFLFWGIKKNKRVHLRRQGMKLLGQDSEIEIIPEALLKKLDEGQIYPTTLLCFLVLLYYNITCLGGFNQVNWLTNIKEKFVCLLCQIDAKKAEKIKEVPTDNFAEGSLAFLESDGELIKASGMDILLKGEDYYSKYKELAKRLALSESIELLLPEIYGIIYNSLEADKNLKNLSFLDIAKANNSHKKILEAVGDN